jgi:hypothetical protein
VTIENAGPSSFLGIDNSADTTSHTNVYLGTMPDGSYGLTGLAPAAITWNSMPNGELDLSDGSGLDAYTINNPGPLQTYIFTNNANDPATVLGNTGLIWFNGQYLAQAMNQLVVSGPAGPVTAGTPFQVTVTALDANGNLVPTYAGTVHFTDTIQKGPLLEELSGPPLHPDYTFTPADHGSHTFTLSLDTAGSQALAATDSASALGGGIALQVTPAAASSFALSMPGDAAAGAPVAVTVTATDAYGNVATGYTGAVYFSSTDVQAGLPADYTFTAADAGAHTFGVTFATGGSQSVTAADTANPALRASASVAVSGGSLPAPTGSPLDLQKSGSQVAMGVTADGTREDFAIGTERALWVRTQAADGSWGAWTSLGGGCQALALAQNPAGYLDAFVIGLDSALWTRRQTGPGAWGTWTKLGGGCKALAAGSNADGSEQVFVIGLDGHLWTRTLAAAGAWGAWTNLGGGCQALAVTRNAAGYLDAYAIGLDSHLWTRHQAAPGSFAAWANLGGGCQALAAGTNADGSEPVYVIGLDGHLWTRTLSAAGAWGAWNNLGGRCLRLAVAQGASGYVDAYVLSTGHAIWTRRQGAAGSWDLWARLGGSYQALVAASTASGLTELLGIDFGGEIWARAQAAPGVWA